LCFDTAVVSSQGGERESFKALLGFSAGRQLSTTQLLTCSLPSGMGKRIRRGKMRKLVGWDKDSLTGKANIARTSKAK